MNSTPSLSAEITTFEEFVAAKSYTPALRKLLDILALIEGGKDGFGGASKECTERSEREATRFCAAVTTFIVDPDFKLNDGSFGAIVRYKRAMAQAFEVSGYRGTSHFLDLIGVKQEDGKRSLRPFETLKLLMVLSANAMHPQLINLLMKQSPKHGIQLVLAFLSEQLLYNPVAENLRSYIFNNGTCWDDTIIAPDTVGNVGPAYMGCSYAVAPNKHLIKRTINKLVRTFLKSREVTDVDLPDERRAVKKRPTILILAELYNSKHAMHRCYGPSIQALREDFKTVYMSSDGKCEDALLPLFDKVDSTPFNAKQPDVFINKVKSYRPDIVYFPSIGMRAMSIFASNVRMAPIQVFTPGHPATSYSDKIDYAVLMKETVGDPNCFTETVLLRDDKPYFEMRDDAQPITPNVREAPSVVRLAVPAWSRKVTPQFLQMCKQISSRSSVPVEFHFFPNGTGALFQAFFRRVEGMLPAVVHPRTGYNDYIRNLNSCDIYLSTFPFGSTNGIVDALVQGLPVVNLKGPEVHTMNDSAMLKNINQPSWLSADSYENYIEAVLRLVRDGKERARISQQILADDPRKKLLVSDNSDMTDFNEIFSAIYKHHEHIKKTGTKAWTYEALKCLESSVEEVHE